MTDAQKALDDAQLVTCLGHLTNFAHNHSEAIMKALHLLAAVEAGTHKVVPVNLLGCQVNAMAAQEFTTDNGNSSYVDLYRVALQAAPDFFGEDG